MKKIVSLSLAITLISALPSCKKKEESEPLYPAIIEFNENGKESFTVGVVRDIMNPDVFVMHNLYYSSQTNILSSKRHILNLGGSNENKVVATDVGPTEKGKYSLSGAIKSFKDGSQYYVFTSNSDSTLNSPTIATYTTKFAEKDFFVVRGKFENFKPKQVVQTSEPYGFFYILGTTEKNSKRYIKLIQYPANLQVKMGVRDLSFLGEGEPVDAESYNNNGACILAYTEAKGAGSRDFWVIKYPNFGTQNNFTFGGSGFDSPNRILAGKEKSMYLIGKSNSFGAGDFDGYIIKLDSNFSMVWQRNFGGSLDDEFTAITEIPYSNSILVAGKTITQTGALSDVFIMEIDKNGNEVWNKKYGHPGFAEHPVAITADERFYYLACNRLNKDSKSSAFFLKDTRGY